MNKRLSYKYKYFFLKKKKKTDSSLYNNII